MVYRLRVRESKNKRAVGCLFVFLCALNGPLLWGMPDADERVQYIRITGQREKPPEAVEEGQVPSETRDHHEAIQGTFRDIAETYFLPSESKDSPASSAAAASSSQSEVPKSKLFNLACFRVVATYRDGQTASLGDFKAPQTLPLFVSGWSLSSVYSPQESSDEQLAKRGQSAQKKGNTAGGKKQKSKAEEKAEKLLKKQEVCGKLKEQFSSIKIVGDFCSDKPYPKLIAEFLGLRKLQFWPAVENGVKQGLSQFIDEKKVAGACTQMGEKISSTDEFLNGLFSFESNLMAMQYFGRSADALFNSKAFKHQFLDSEQAIRLFVELSCSSAYVSRDIDREFQEAVNRLERCKEELSETAKRMDQHERGSGKRMLEGLEKQIDFQKDERTRCAGMLDWKSLKPDGKTLADLQTLSFEIATYGEMCQTCQGTYWYDLTEAHKLEDAILKAIFGGNTQKSREYKFEVLISSCHSMDKSRERLPVFLYSLRK